VREELLLVVGAFKNVRISTQTGFTKRKNSNLVVEVEVRKR
jgi:hypothetical protein